MLFDIYNILVRRFPDGCPHLFGSAVDGHPKLWLSVNTDAHPHVLFEASENDAESDLKLKYVEVQFSRPCEITLKDGTAKSGTYSVVTLKDDDPDIVRVFLRLLEEAFFCKGARHDAGTIRRQILAIAELFSSLDTSLRDVVGLWGELYLLGAAIDVNSAVRAWCLSSKARFDYVTDTHILEVKSTLKSTREHRFSLEQLRHGSEMPVYVVSILLTELSSGKTVGECVDEIYALILDAEDRNRFFRQCLTKGGKDIYGSELRLGTYPGGKSVAVYPAASLPSPQVANGDPIRNVRFEADITNVKAMSLATAAKLLGFSVQESGALM